MLGVLFLAAFIVLLGIGGGAPDVLFVHSSSGTDEDPNSLKYNITDGLNTYRSTFSLTRENQLFWVDVRLGTNGLEALPVLIDIDDISVNVGVGGS